MSAKQFSLLHSRASTSVIRKRECRDNDTSGHWLSSSFFFLDLGAFMQPPGSSFVLVVVLGLTGLLSGPHLRGSLYGGHQSDTTSTTSTSTAPPEVLTGSATTPPSSWPRVFILPLWFSSSVFSGLLLVLLIFTLGAASVLYLLLKVRGAGVASAPPALAPSAPPLGQVVAAPQVPVTSPKKGTPTKLLPGKRKQVKSVAK